MGMHDVIEDKRIFRRGFLLSASSRKPHVSWKTKELVINGGEVLYLSYDPDNEAVYIDDACGYVIVLGTMMDVIDYTMDKTIIASNLIQKLSRRKEEFYDYMDCICGRYVIIYGRSGELPHVLQDATGMRSVFYDESILLVASHIELVQLYAQENAIPFFAEYLKNNENIENNNIGLPGNWTPYQRIKALIPNHELDTRSKKQYRFWPRHYINRFDLDTTCMEAIKCFSKQAEVLVKNYPHLCLSFTSGKDSYVSLKAFSGFEDHLDFFTYYDPEERIRGTDTHKDTSFAKEYCEKNHYKYHCLHLETEASQKTLYFCKVNTWHRHITRAVDKYLEVFSDDYLHLRSNLLEIVRNRAYYRASNITNNPQSYYKYRYSNYDEKLIMPLINDYWKEAQFDKIYDFDFPSIFYWEERCGMWHGGSVLLESDIAFDTYILFNYRNFYERMLSVDNKLLNSDRLYEMLVCQ